jgi:hypothetical protein
MDHRIDGAKESPADALIHRIAREQVLVQQIRAGKTVDDATRDQFAKALRVSAGELTAEKELEYLQNLIAEQKGRLRAELMQLKDGEPYNFKLAQAESMRTRHAQLAAEHNIEIPSLKPAEV